MGCQMAVATSAVEAIEGGRATRAAGPASGPARQGSLPRASSSMRPRARSGSSRPRARSSSARRRSKKVEAQRLSPRVISPDYTIELMKHPGDKLGVSLGNTSKGAVIFSLKPGGMLEKYNETASEERKLRTWFIIVEVNGKTGYWDVFEEMRRVGPMRIVISPTPPEGASANWFEEVQSMERDLQTQGSNIVVKDQKGAFSSLDTVRAGDVGVDECAICLGEVGPNSTLVQLPCGHAFHVTCCGRWLTETGKHARGKKQCCPLCCRPVVPLASDAGDGSGDSDAQN